MTTELIDISKVPMPLDDAGIKILSPRRNDAGRMRS
jgi:hypothetical protein